MGFSHWRAVPPLTCIIDSGREAALSFSPQHSGLPGSNYGCVAVVASQKEVTNCLLANITGSGDSDGSTDGSKPMEGQVAPSSETCCSLSFHRLTEDSILLRFTRRDHNGTQSYHRSSHRHAQGPAHNPSHQTIQPAHSESARARPTPGHCGSA